MSTPTIDDAEWLRRALGLVQSVSQDERTALIQRGHANEQLTALAVMTHTQFTMGYGMQTLRVLLDTAYCLGVRAERLRGKR